MIMKNKILIIGLVVVLIGILIYLLMPKTNNNTDYIIKASIIDNYSPDRELTVYKGQEKINFQEIRYENDNLLCKGNLPYAAKSDIEKVKRLKVILEDGSVVIARIEEN